MLIEDILNEFKRTHLEHIEDIVLTDGYQGGQAVVNYYRGLLVTLQGTSSEPVQVSVKWDGAPAVVCGTNPNNGKFFVGTKSVFAKTPKINYTKNDIAKNHGTDDLGKKLLKCLVHLKKINIQGVVQGDLLFTDDDIATRPINGKSNLVFTPNTITYAVEQGTEIGNQIEAAKLGIIFHTSYTGDRLADMDASAGVDIQGFNRSPAVFFDNATYKDVSGSAKFTKDETANFMQQIDTLDNLLKALPRNIGDMFKGNQDFVPFFQMYINDQVKQGKVPTNANAFIKGFQIFYNDRLKKQIAGLKAQKAIDLRKSKLQDMPLFLNKLKRPLQAMLSFYKQTQIMKMFILKKMNQAMQIGSFQQTDSGLEVTEPEGFVAVDKQGGAVKLVDRLGFSRRNLTAIKKFQPK